MVVLLCLSSGCGTIMRNEIKSSGVNPPMVWDDADYGRQQYYPATYLDMIWLEHGLIFSIIDVPISLASDTVLLPYDIATYKPKQNP
jgi:uncharacterized protein YceK